MPRQVVVLRDPGSASAYARKRLERRLDVCGIGIPGQRCTLIAIGQHIAALGARRQLEEVLQTDRRAEAQLATVANDHVVQIASRQRVLAKSADQHVATGATQQAVIAALQDVQRGDRTQGREARHLAGVTLLALIALQHDADVRSGHAGGVQRVAAQITMQDQQALLCTACEVGHDDGVVARVAVDAGHVTHAQAGHIDMVVAGAGPNVHAACKTAGGGGVVDVGGGHAAQQRGADLHRRVGIGITEVADVQRVVASARIQPQHAADRIQAVEAGRRAAHADREDIVTGVAADHRRRRAALNEQLVGAAAQAQRQTLDALVMDAVLARGQLRLSGQGGAIDLVDAHRASSTLEGEHPAVAMPADGQVLRVWLARVVVVGVHDGLQHCQHLSCRGVHRDGVRPDTLKFQPQAATGARIQAERLHIVGEARQLRAIAAGGDAHLGAGVRRRHQGVDRARATVPEQRWQVLPRQITAEADRVAVAELLDGNTGVDAEQLVQPDRQVGGADTDSQHYRVLHADRIAAVQHLATHTQRELPGNSAHSDDLLLDHRRHAQASERRAGQLARGVGRVGGVVYVDGVSPRTTEHRQQTGHLIDAVAGAGHADHVIAVAGIDQGGARQRFDVECVCAAAPQDAGAAGMGGEHVEGVVAETQLDVDGLEVPVAEATLQCGAADDGVGAHAQTVDAVLGQPARIVGGAVGVAQIEHVNLHHLVDEQVRVQRRKVVVGAHHGSGTGRRPVAGEQHRVVAHGRVVQAGVVYHAGQAPDGFLQRLACQRGVAVDDIRLGAAAQRHAVHAASLPADGDLRQGPLRACGQRAGDARRTSRHLCGEVRPAADQHGLAIRHGAAKDRPHLGGQVAGHSEQGQAIGRVGAVAEGLRIERQSPVLRVGHHAFELHPRCAVQRA